VCLDDAAVAGPIDYSASEDAATFGHLRQADLRNCGTLAGTGCGPTAAANSFLFLESQYPSVYRHTLIPTDPPDLDLNGVIDTYDGLIFAGNSLSLNIYMKTCCNQTTLRDDFFFGKQRYIEDRVPSVTIYEVMDDPALNTLDPNGNFDASNLPPGFHAQAPTPQFLSANLKAGEDIEILLTRDNGTRLTFGHYVTVFGLQWIDHDMDGRISPADGRATLSYIDPAQTAGHQEQMRPLLQRANGLLAIRNEATGVESDIRFAVKESPRPELVPEPSSLLLVVSGLSVILVLRTRSAREESKYVKLHGRINRQVGPSCGRSSARRSKS
jgi:hypothetical protein